MSEQQFKDSVSTHLKKIRKQRGLSLDAVAKLTGVSKAMLGQIERKESSPTIAKLWQIASGLETSFSAFLHTTNEQEKAIAFPDDPYMKIQTLFSYDKSVNYEIHEITLTNFHYQKSQAHAHGVIESIIVLDGELELSFAGEKYHIKQGGTLRFYADQPHSYKSISETSTFQNIVSY